MLDMTKRTDVPSNDNNDPGGFQALGDVAASVIEKMRASREAGPRVFGTTKGGEAEPAAHAGPTAERAGGFASKG